MELKKIYYSFMIVTFFCISIEGKNSSDDTKNLKFSYQDPHLTHYIGTSNFRLSGETSLTGTYTISNPGIYVLTNDISSSVGTGSSCILYINSSDVHIDLSGHSLVQANSTASIDGILINSSLANISIQNGSIRDVTESGISISSSTTDVFIKDMFIRGAEEAGISIDGGLGTEVKNVRLENCTLIGNDGGGTTDGIGLKINYCDYLTAINSTFNVNSNTTVGFDGYGVYVENSKGGTFIDCQANGNAGELVGAGFSLITSCTGFKFKNCTANQNSAVNITSSESYGFYNNGSDHTFFQDCQASYNTCPNTSAGFKIMASKNNQFINCLADGNKATGSALTTNRGAGFMINSSENYGHQFRNCTAFGNQGGGNSNAVGAGFSFEFSSNCILVECNANANGGTAAFGVGFDLLATCTLCVLQSCQANSNTSTTSQKGIGFRDAGGSSTNLLIENFAFGNRDTNLAAIEKNYNVLYLTTNSVQEVAMDSISNITVPTRRNISVTP